VTSVLGLPLEQATQLLSKEGIQVTCVEVRSRKGVPDGTQLRVIRQTNLDANHASLLYAVFRTKPNEANA
jgi:hypothetical protein